MEHRLFYFEDITEPTFTLNAEESGHIVRVLRMKEGDVVDFTDGKGNLFHCRLLDENHKACQFEVMQKTIGKDHREFEIHMAVAPTKNINRYEWFLEKATEIGVDRILPFTSKHSERKVIKKDRLNRVITAAVKQSLKTFHPVLDELTTFQKLIDIPFDGDKFIAYIDENVTLELSQAYHPNKNALILIGPEGGFSPEEAAQAKASGFEPVRLGPSRLRTETAAVAACHTIHILNY
jgi:16S rRNA (uracil1498-N3)-methyltransferase